MDIILASASKRRSLILSSCGIKHKVIKSRIPELTSGKSPSFLSMQNAFLKAMDVSSRLKKGYAIAADTVVKIGKKIIGKPRDEGRAKRLLKEMSGKTVYVYTGLCIVDVKTKKLVKDYECSIIKVRRINDREISRYFKLLGPYDKAGGFSIEGVGSFIFDNIKGSYFNILGLPTAKLKEMFERLGVDLLDVITSETQL